MTRQSIPLQYRKLISAAKAAKRRSYSPYSRFRVGAALLTRKGKIYTGCNIENSSFGLTICAERTAIFKAVSEGENKFVAVAVVSDDQDFTPPCGACRQVFMDLASTIDFIMTDGKGHHKVIKLDELLPYPFNPDHLRKK